MTLPVDWRLPARGGRPLIITTSSHHHHTCSQAWPGVTAQLGPPSPHNLIRSHVPDVLFLFHFSRQGFIFPWLDDGCCCLRDLGAVRGPNVLIRVGGAGSRALMEAHAHTTSCTAENIYLSCRHNYHKATVYRRCFKCLVYRFFIRIVYTRARRLPSTSHCSCQRLRSSFYFISLISFMSGCSGHSFLVWCTTGMTLFAILLNCLKMSIYSIYWSF